MYVCGYSHRHICIKAVMLLLLWVVWAFNFFGCLAVRLTSLVSGNLTPLNVVFSAADPLLLMHFLVTLHCCLLSLLHDLLLLLMLLQLLLVRGILPLHFRSLYNTIAHLKCVPKQKSLSRNTQRVVEYCTCCCCWFCCFSFNMCWRLRQCSVFWKKIFFVTVVLKFFSVCLI